jgi:hypothetical protein
MDQGIEKVYFFMHQHEELHSPELCRYLVNELNKHCGTQIPVPEFVDEASVPHEEPSVKKVARKTSKKIK